MTQKQSLILASTLAFLGLGCPADEPPGSEGSEGTTSGSATTGDTTAGSPTGADTGTGSDTAAVTDDGTTETEGETETEGCVGACPGAVSTDPCPTDVAARYALVGVHRRQTEDPSPGCKDSCYWPSAAIVTYDPKTGIPTEIGESRPDIVPHALAVADDESIIVAGEDRPLDFEPGTQALMRFDDETGQALWDLELQGGVILDVAVFGEEVVALASPGVAAFALADGAPAWEIDLGELQLRRLVVEYDGSLYVIGSESADFVRKFDPEHAFEWEVLDTPVDGEERSLVELTHDEPGGVVIGTQVRIVATDDQAFDVRKLDADGNEVYTLRFDAGAAAGAPWDDAIMDLESLPGGGVVVAGRSAESGGVALLAVIATDGNILSSSTTNRDERTGEWFQEAVALGDDTVAFGCGEATWLAPVI